MKRISTSPRPDWQPKVEDLGLSYHTIDDEIYWDESAYYEFTSSEIDTLETATMELQRICVEAAELAIREDWRAKLHIPEAAWTEIIAAWERDDPTLYGRFDLLWDGTDQPKMLEYNADTPTGLLEASVVQWHWLEEKFPDRDQFNSLHESLLASWDAWPAEMIHFTAMQRTEEDWRNVLYLEDTARQAGKNTANFALEQLGFDPHQNRFVADNNGHLELLFKLYPWEWMWQEEFGKHLPGNCSYMLEPVWKMLWSNKAFLTLLWEKFPNHPNLLAAGNHSALLGPDYVIKPIFGREGANVILVEKGESVAVESGPWGEQPVVYQKLGKQACFDGNYPIIGSWVIGGESAGIGIREDRKRITSNASRFIPHLF